MAYANVNGVSMFYTDEGEGSPVVLVHGWSCDGSDWAWQTPALNTFGACNGSAEPPPLARSLRPPPRP